MARSLVRSSSVVVVLALGCKSSAEKPPAPVEMAERMGKAAQGLGTTMAGQADDLGKQADTFGERLAKQGEALGKQGAAQAREAERIAAAQAMATGASRARPRTVGLKPLKALLPASVGGLEQRESAGYERTSTGGLAFSQAVASYHGDGAEGRRIDIRLLDIGIDAGPAAMATVGWGALEIDSKKADGSYERTTKIGDRKALEKYDRPSKSGELKVVAGNRFLVEIQGSAVEMDDLKNVLAKLDLAKLESLKPAPAAK